MRLTGPSQLNVTESNKRKSRACASNVNENKMFERQTRLNLEELSSNAWASNSFNKNFANACRALCGSDFFSLAIFAYKNIFP